MSLCYILVTLSHMFYKKIWSVSGDEESDVQLSSSVTRLSAEGKYYTVNIQSLLKFRNI